MIIEIALGIVLAVLILIFWRQIIGLGVFAIVVAVILLASLFLMSSVTKNIALLFLLDTLVQPFAALLLLRFHLQWLRAPLRNPLGEFIMTLTNFLVLRARRFIPAAWGFDAASLLLAFVVEAIYLAAMLWAQGFPFIGFPLFGLLAWTAVKLLKLSVYLLMGALFAQAILSWVNPHSPVEGLLNVVTYPFLAPLRRRIPPLGNIDLTVLILIIVCQLILIVPMGWLESVAVRLL